MEITYRSDARMRAICDLGHEVEVFAADGVVAARVHRELDLVVDPDGKPRHRKCPACEEAANRLMRLRFG